jgi:hypothetical protein
VVCLLLGYIDKLLAVLFGLCIARKLLTWFYVRVLGDASFVRADVRKDDFHQASCANSRPIKSDHFVSSRNESLLGIRFENLFSALSNACTALSQT